MGGINYKQQKYGSISPGPGKYGSNNKAAIETRVSYSMGKKLGSSIMSKSVTQNPGAGSYEPVAVFKKDGNTVFGKDRRHGIFDEKKAKFVPGPNVYK